MVGSYFFFCFVNVPVAFRPALAALLILGGLAGAYRTAVRWPGQAVAASPPGPDSPAPADTLADTVVDTLAPLPAPAPSPPDPTPTQEGSAATGPHDPRPLFKRVGPLGRTLRRYVGTVGGQPATVLLDWQHPDWPRGRFYLHRGGPEYKLDHLSRLPRNVLQVSDASGEWHLPGRPGATLTGTWRGGPSGRAQAVRLHEDYHDAVRLDIQTWRVSGRYTFTTSRGLTYNSVPTVQWEFMHLANPASVPPALRPLLSPSPARRRRLLLEKGDIDCSISNELTVRLNDSGLLGYQYYWMVSGIGGSGDADYQHALFDLRAGRWLAPESQLRPGYELELSRLLAQRLLRNKLLSERTPEWNPQLRKLLTQEHDTLRAATRWVQQVLPEPIFTGAGMELECRLDDFIDASYREHFTVFFSYRELRPLVRPGTPLARMLRTRGLW